MEIKYYEYVANTTRYPLFSNNNDDPVTQLAYDV